MDQSSFGPESVSKQVVSEMMYRVDVNLSLKKIGKLPYLRNRNPYSALIRNNRAGSERFLARGSLGDPSKLLYIFKIKNQFLSAALQAFCHHIGFVLAPQQLFLVILQQIGIHVNCNSDQLRSQFVTFDEKKKIVVEVSTSPSEEEWARAFQNIRQQIAENTVPDTYDLFSLEPFSTASINEKVAGDITLMDVCQSFFDYSFMSLCGIPYFILEGTVEDWELLREKVEQLITRKTLPELQARWLPALLPTLDKIIRTRRGEENDKFFWESFFKVGSQGGSGASTYVSGWINCFFPLLQEEQWNPFCQPFHAVPLYLQKLAPPRNPKEKNKAPTTGENISVFDGLVQKAVDSLGTDKEKVEEEDEDEDDDDDSDEDEEYSDRVSYDGVRLKGAPDGSDLQNYPAGFSKVPSIWKLPGETKDITIYSGFVCSKYEDDVIRPVVSWWVSEKS